MARLACAMSCTCGARLLTAAWSLSRCWVEVWGVDPDTQCLTAQAAGVRQACGAALLAFLLDYPLGGARLRHHRDFLVANLAYEHDAGRLAVLDMLQVNLPRTPMDSEAHSLGGPAMA